MYRKNDKISIEDMDMTVNLGYAVSFEIKILNQLAQADKFCIRKKICHRN